MKTDELFAALGAREYAPAPVQALCGCYIGDLLSRVLGRACAGGVWITIMNNINVAAVALMADIPLVLLAEDVVPAPELVEKCREENIGLWSAPQPAYALALRIGALA